MTVAAKRLLIRDTTLREGLDTPGVTFSLKQKLRIVSCLAKAGVGEIEVVAPSRVLSDLAVAGRIRAMGYPVRTSGLIYCSGPEYEAEVMAAGKCLDRFDLLMPLSPLRAPFKPKQKIALLKKLLAFSAGHIADVGVGFPQSTQDTDDLLYDLSILAVSAGAGRIVVYDTNGSGSPATVSKIIKRLKSVIAVPIMFHGHNDLGLATANSLMAVEAGADGVDVTVNGLGDRAGNASLEQVVLNLELSGYATGVDLGRLRSLSKLVEIESGVPVSMLAPVTGKFIFQHKSPGHLRNVDLFQAYDPMLIGVKSDIVK